VFPVSKLSKPSKNKQTMKRHNFKKLQIWQEAIELVTLNYGFTATLPDYEKFGLRSQLNRCSVSIASNISEGTSKRTNKHFMKYLDGDSWVKKIKIIKRYETRVFRHKKQDNLK